MENEQFALIAIALVSIAVTILLYRFMFKGETNKNKKFALLISSVLLLSIVITKIIFLNHLLGMLLLITLLMVGLYYGLLKPMGHH